MNVIPIIQSIKQNSPCFNGQVFGAVEYSDAVTGKFNPPSLPAAFVLYDGFEAEPNSDQTGMVQWFKVKVAVVVFIPTSGDLLGFSGITKEAAIQTQLFKAVYNYNPFGPIGSTNQRANRGFYAKDAFLMNDWNNSRLAYQYNFEQLQQYTDEDGYQIPSTPITQINAINGVTFQVTPNEN